MKLESFPPKFTLAWAILFSTLLVSGWLVWMKYRGRMPSPEKSHAVTMAASSGLLVASVPSPAASTPPNLQIARGGVHLRPLAVAQESKKHQWTAGDGRSDAVISQIAHNFDEYQRMVEENDRIKRRQLVYRKETAAELIQRSRLTGTPVERLTLPGIDGQEIEFEVTHADLAPSGQSGSFSGRVAGRGQSMVTFAFKFGREAFSVISPEDGVFLQADPWEPGEMIVKSIDPATYVPGECGNQ